MSLHFGVLMYSNRDENVEIAPQILAPGKYLEELGKMREDLSTMIDASTERDL